jgi:hypothetical protein
LAKGGTNRIDPAKGLARPIISVSERPLAGENTAVDCVHNRCSADHASAKVPSIQALDGILSALNLVELEVDVALRVGIQSNVYDVAVLLFGFLSNVIFEFLDPLFTFLPAVSLVIASTRGRKGQPLTQRRQKHCGEPRNDWPC